MILKKVKERLKSPIVMIQIIGIFESFLISLIPVLENEWKAIALLLINMINILAGLNNPSDKEHF